MHRGDLTTSIPGFIALAESRIRHDVRCRAMEQTATGTLSSTTLALPDRFAEVRRVVVNDRVQSYVTPEAFHPLDAEATDQYTIVGTNFKFQSATADYTIDYYQWFAALADDGDTNWLLTNFHEIYLAASMFEANEYINGNGDKWLMRYKLAVDRLRNTERNNGARLVVRPELARGYLP